MSFLNKIKLNYNVKLIDDYLENLDNQTLIQGLRLVGDYLDKTILKPNNINFPSSRLDFVNILK